jgi:hypothetical protein
MSEEQIINEISAIVEGAGLFRSTGYSRIAVTTGGIKRILKIPIATLGVDEIIKGMELKAPRPPVIVRTATNEEAEAMGETGHVEIRTYDFTDPEYLKAIERHGDEGTWRVAIQGMNIAYGGPLDSAEALTFEKKKEILLAHGITTRHIIQIFKDIRKLTVVQEDREDFLQKGQSDSQQK